MKIHLLFLAVLLHFVCLTGICGQSKLVNKRVVAKQYSNYKNKEASLNHQNFFEAMTEKMQLSAGTEMKLQKTVVGRNGYAHYKYQQFFQDVPIVGGTYILHEKNGVVERATGCYAPDVRVETNAKLNASTALSLAKQQLRADKYAETQPQPILCLVDPQFPTNSGMLRLAYQVDLTSIEPFDKRRLYVDARAGKVFMQLPLILNEGVPSKAHTRYHGVKDIITDSLGPSDFHLHDPTRGEGITVYRPDLTVFTNTSSNWDLTNADQDEVALDAHYCSQEYYDMMLELFGWNGLDGNGKELKVQVHNNGAGEVNAFWDGEFTNYGDGNCIYGPLTTLEVVGHEFAHGFTQHTSKLVYAGESGAINECMSDIFGKLLERKTDPDNFSWDLGHSFLLTPEAKPFRVMDDPASVDMPDFYKGALWFDYSGVHTNSAVGNLWYSMVVDGRQGTNEIGENYDVPAIGIEKAGQIAFLANSAYLTENSDYNDFYEYTMLASAELFGAGSLEQQAVQEAWMAVGLPSAPSQALDLGLSATYNVDGRCGVGQYYPISFEVVNTGGQPYEPSMGASVKLVDYDEVLPDYIIELDEPIAPGESIIITVEDWFIPNDAGLYFLNIELNFADENTSNNYSWNGYEIVEHQADDLTLSIYNETPGCFTKDVTTYFSIVSESCETMPAGTPVSLKVSTASGALLWSTTYTLQNDLPGFGLEGFESEVDLSALPFGESVFYEIETGNDPNQENNLWEQEYPFIRTIDGNYLNTFSDADEDAYLEVNNFFSDPIVLYQSDYFFASTGLYNNPESLVHCPDYEANFESDFYSGINATLRACLDFSASQTPLLEFDLALLRNDSASAENFLHSSMLQAKWTGTQDGSDIIFDQPEGEVVNHSYQLPFNFKGALSLKLYTEIGTWQIDPLNFETDDFVLLDNLRLSATSTDAKEELQNGRVKISPNPTQGMVWLKSEHPLSEVAIYNLNGQAVRQVQVGATELGLDVAGLAPGFYTLKVLLADGRWVSEKLVKI
ncbi:MAG: M4 family metallopeptidase [Saprospiraceae bacterium]|nr:M4 family metallopeptidase [Saprospiraceae bacterium]